MPETIETTTPRLRTVRIDVANLTDTQARFLRGVVAIVTENGPTLRLLEQDRLSIRMDLRTGEAFALPDDEPKIGHN